MMVRYRGWLMSNRVRIVDRRGAAFTLIELLVVVAIVAVLAAILVPALSRAREQAYQVRCAANLKNFGLGIFYYVHDRSNGNGYLPLFGCEVEMYPGAYWANQILPYVKVKRSRVGQRTGFFRCPAHEAFMYVRINGRDGYGLHAGTLASEEDKRRADAGDPDAPGPQILIESMSYTGTNDMLVTGQRWPGVASEETPRRMLDLDRPYCQMLLTEASHRIAYCFRWADIVHETSHASAKVQRNYRRHYGGSSDGSNGMNWLFADGHAQWYSARSAAEQLICCVDLGRGQWTNLNYSRAVQTEKCAACPNINERRGRGDGRR